MRISDNRSFKIPLGVWLPAAWLVLQFLLMMWGRSLARAQGTSAPVWPIILLTVLQAAYLLPGIFASARGHPHRLFIWLVTLFLGWTGIGWLVAMIWAAISGDRLSAGMTTVRAIVPMSPNGKPTFGGGSFLPQGLAPKSFLPPDSVAPPSFLSPQPGAPQPSVPPSAPAPDPAAPQFTPFAPPTLGALAAQPDAAPPAFIPSAPAPKSLRVELAEKALAELETQKADGKIAEADYQARRADLLAQL